MGETAAASAHAANASVSSDVASVGGRDGRPLESSNRASSRSSSGCVTEIAQPAYETPVMTSRSSRPGTAITRKSPDPDNVCRCNSSPVSTFQMTTLIKLAVATLLPLPSTASPRRSENSPTLRRSENSTICSHVVAFQTTTRPLLPPVMTRSPCGKTETTRRPWSLTEWRPPKLSLQISVPFSRHTVAGQRYGLHVSIDFPDGNNSSSATESPNS
mmetsp:Transcript_76089/g.220965  ORF Transcript_76089/g.220965 Transcript_76089/m.220965 type:complete len:216 (-) Transcript_76089:134-781(-)